MGAFHIIFERNGYGGADVVESQLYVYVGKRGERANFIPDTAPYANPIEATKEYITQDAINAASAYPWRYTSGGTAEIKYGINLDNAPWASGVYVDTTSAVKYNGSLSADYNDSDGYYGQKDVLCSWRHVKFTEDKYVYMDKGATVVLDGNNKGTLVNNGGYYKLRRKNVFQNPLPSSSSGDVSAYNIYADASDSEYPFTYKTEYRIASPNDDKHVCLEVRFDDIFYTGWAEYEDKVDESGKFSNIDYDPRNGKLQVSTKDRDKLLFDILKGKTPIFFMIVEKLNKSYAGLSNLIVLNSGSKITAVSTKRQVIADRYCDIGTEIWDKPFDDTTFRRICVELAQGDEEKYRWNPGIDDNRMVWASSYEGGKAKLYCFDYFNGDSLIKNGNSVVDKIEYGNYPILAMAANPCDRSLVFVRVLSNRDNFAEVVRMTVSKNGAYRIQTIRTISDYAKKSRFSMLGEQSPSEIADKITGGVIGRHATDNSFWFTFIVNMEFTVSVKVNESGGEPVSGDAAFVRWADRMHYGLFHGRNFAGNYRGKASNNYIEKFRNDQSPYLSGFEYGVPRNQKNVVGITNCVGGDIYVNGHTYFHFDNKWATYVDLATIYSPTYALGTWQYDGTNPGCGHYVKNRYTATDTSTHAFVLSHVVDMNTGKWKKNREGKFVMGYRSPFKPGCWPVSLVRIDAHPNTSTAYFTSDAMKDMPAGKHAKQYKDGNHTCRMATAAWRNKKPSEYAWTVGQLGEMATSWDQIEGGQSNPIVVYGEGWKEDDIGACMPKGDVRPNIGSDVYEELGCTYTDYDSYPGTGWDCHMGSVSITGIHSPRSGGDMFYIMQDIGFIYNANAYDANNSNDAVVMANSANIASTADRFWMTNGLSEDSSNQLGTGVTIDADGIYNFNVGQSTMATNINTVTGINGFRMQDGHLVTSASFAFVFDCTYAGDVLAPCSAVGNNIFSNYGNRVGFMEDVQGSPTIQHPRAKNNSSVITGNDVLGYKDFVVDNPVQYGLVESMDNSGSLSGGNILQRYIYQSLAGESSGMNDHSRTFSQVNRLLHQNDSSQFGHGIVFSGASAFTSVTSYPIYSLVSDDANGIWAICSGETVLGANFGGIVTTMPMRPSYTNDGTQVTNFGHNRCKHPYFEHAAWKTERPTPFTYDNYFGAKDLVKSEQSTAIDGKYGVSANIVATASFAFGPSAGTEYNDDPVGMAGVKALGYCWTKSTKAHCMDVAPSGRMLIIDHYVMGHDCDNIDNLYINAKSESSDYYSIGAAIQASATSAFGASGFDEESKSASAWIGGWQGSAAFMANLSSVTAASFDDFTTNSIVSIINKWDNSVDGFEFYRDNGISSYFIGTDESSASFKWWVTGGQATSAEHGGRPRNGLPRFPQSFWDFTTDEPWVFERESDEKAAIDAFAEVGMIKTNPIYLSDFSTIVKNPVSQRCAGYDKLYTNHLVYVYDCGTYDIEKVEYTFHQNDDYGDGDKSKTYTAVVRGDALSSMTIGDADISRQGQGVSFSNNDYNRYADAMMYMKYRDAMCCSASVLEAFGDGWDSINAYGKPDGFAPITALDDSGDGPTAYMGNPLSAVYGQTVPKQWYGTEIYRNAYSDGGDYDGERITYMHEIQPGISAYGFHPSLYPSATTALSSMAVVSAGALVQNSKLGLYGVPHTVKANATSTEFCYVDPWEEAKPMSMDLGVNYVYVYERWPTQRWSVHCENSRGGLDMFGKCPDFDEEDFV